MQPQFKKAILNVNCQANVPKVFGRNLGDLRKPSGRVERTECYSN